MIQNKITIFKQKIHTVNLNGVLPDVRSAAYKQVGKRRTTKQDFKVNYYITLALSRYIIVITILKTYIFIGKIMYFIITA